MTVCAAPPPERPTRSTGETIITARSFDRQAVAAEPTVAVHALASDQICRLGCVGSRLNATRRTRAGTGVGAKSRGTGGPSLPEARLMRADTMGWHRASASDAESCGARRAVPPDGDGGGQPFMPTSGRAQLGRTMKSLPSSRP